MKYQYEITLTFIKEYLIDEDELMDRDNDNTIEFDTSSLTSVIGRMTKAILEVPEDFVEEIRVLPDTLIAKDNVKFYIKMSDKPEIFNVYFVCEAASRVLFETIRWTRSIQVDFFLIWVPQSGLG